MNQSIEAKKLPCKLWGLLLIAALLPSCGEKIEDVGSPTWPEKVPEKIDFYKHVRPLLVINCVECHNSRNAIQYMGVNLQTKEGAMTSGINGPVIIPGDPDNSLLLQVLDRNPEHEWAMPPTPDRVWGARKEILRRWIAEGAPWPDGIVLELPSEVEEW